MRNRSTKNIQFITSLFLTSLLLLADGCRREQVQVYQVAANQDQSDQTDQAAPPQTNASNPTLPPGQPDMSGMDNSSMPSAPADANSSAPPILAWTVPAGWTEVPPSEMRVGSFKVAGAGGKQADVSIIPLSGMAGGDFANVNRWRGQVGLPPLADNDLQNLAENVEVAGQPAQLYDLAGQSSRILGVIQHRDGTAWFYKMTGDPALVGQQKSTFIAFLKSLNFPSENDQTQLPPGHPAIGDMSTPASPASTQNQPDWQVPSGWQPVSAGQFLVAKFLLTGQNGATAEVNVAASAGDGGGLLPNINRWRGQLGLPAADEISTMTFAVSGGQAQLVDFTGVNAQTGRPAELVGVVVTLPGQTWFYKLMGDPALVAAQKDAFTQFVKGARY